VRPGLKEKIEHARIGGSDGQGGEGVVGPGLAQRLQQIGDGVGVRGADAGATAALVERQGNEDEAGPGLAQLLQQPGDGGRVVEVGVGGGVAGQQDRHGVAGARAVTAALLYVGAAIEAAARRQADDTDTLAAMLDDRLTSIEATIDAATTTPAPFLAVPDRPPAQAWGTGPMTWTRNIDGPGASRQAPRRGRELRPDQ
jgi:hypothetical protein